MVTRTRNRITFSPRRAALRLVGAAALLALAACNPTSVGGLSGQSVNPNKTVQIALLVPNGSGRESDALLARNLENAARLAIADQTNAKIDLRVYDTAGTPQQASNAAIAAVNDGAKIILGPLYAEAANAAAVAIAGTNTNVLAFSNNASIAGGNLFILGPTFENTANRLVNYGRQIGKTNILIAHAEELAGQVGRDAIISAANRNGATITGVESYPFSQDGINNAARRISATVKETGADTLFVTAGPESDLPFLMTALPERGLGMDIQLMGLTRWSSQPQSLALPGLQGGVFTLPDQALERNFAARYQAEYSERPHPIAGLSYDGIAAIGALLAQGRSDALTSPSLTRQSGFVGTQGIFRLMPDGTNERGLAVAKIENNQVAILDPAPKNFSGAGF
ncbi:penicillin-binding protein activator [Nereida ignava]|uniref:Putative lipoprotein n=1 Tax=Nereida ignava TaxID=282199 RepID=A0A0U1NM99_9RHOB|nr:penicillin-binding protein activator [Nereida ignava]CRK75854.1 Putative lipoprotein [Nereida ignava]SFJ35149.1 amino acid/amide ABC transporter substrate-binding protein, HAAT family (TC 3.A.1.4.-) [Nereida ignava DSM 16309]